MARGAARSSRDGTLRIVIVGDDHDLDRSLKGANRKLAVFGAAAIAAVGAVAASSVRAFSEFDRKMTESVAIMGDVSSAMRNDMSQAAREVGRTTVFSAAEAAEAYFFLASAGLDAEQSIAALPRVAAFAQAGMFDMAQATDLLTDAQSALGLAADDAQTNLRNMERVGDVLVRANTLANASVEQFATALTSKSAAAMRTFNIEVETGVAALAVFADQGLKGEAAGTILARTIEGLAARARVNEQAFRDLGVEVFDQQGGFRNLADIAADLEQGLAGMTTQQTEAALAQLGLNERTRQGVLLMLGNSEALRGYETELNRAGGTMDRIAARQLESLSAKFGLFRDRITDVQITIGSLLAPALESMIGAGSGLLDMFEGLDPAQQAATVTAIGLGVAAAGVALAFQGASAAAVRLGTSLGVMTAKAGPIGLLLAGVGAAIGFFMGRAAETRQRVEALADTLDDLSGAITDTTREMVLLRLQGEGATDAARQLGISMDTLVDAALGNEDAVRRVTAATMQLYEAYEGDDTVTGAVRDYQRTAEAVATVERSLGRLTPELRESQQQTRQTAVDAAELRGEFVDLQHAIDAGLDPSMARLALANQRAGDSSDDLQDELDEQRRRTEEVDEAAAALRTQMGLVADETDTAAAATREYNQAQRELVDPVFAVFRAQQRHAEAMERVNQMSRDGKKGTREYDSALLDTISSASDMDAALRELDAAYSDIDLATASAQDRLKFLEDQFGLSGGAANLFMGLLDDYARRARTLPTAEAKVDNRDALRRFREVERAADRAARNRTARIHVTSTGMDHATMRNLLRMHDGGFVPRRMHDGGMVEPEQDLRLRLAADEVPVILQTGERVLSRSEVALLDTLFAGARRMHDGGMVAQSRPAPSTSTATRTSGGDVALLGEIRDLLEQFVESPTVVRIGDETIAAANERGTRTRNRRR